MKVDYYLRNIESDLWEQVKARAEHEGRPLRWILIAMLQIYAKHGFAVFEPLRTNGPHRKHR